MKKVEQQISTATEFMDNLKLSIADLAAGITDSKIKRAVGEVVDEIQYSPPASKEFLKPLEKKISEDVQRLKAAIETGNNDETLGLCKSLLADIKERNRRAKS